MSVIFGVTGGRADGFRGPVPSAGQRRTGITRSVPPVPLHPYQEDTVRAGLIRLDSCLGPLAPSALSPPTGRPLVNDEVATNSSRADGPLGMLVSGGGDPRTVG